MDSAHAPLPREFPGTRVELRAALGHHVREQIGREIPVRGVATRIGKIASHVADARIETRFDFIRPQAKEAMFCRAHVGPLVVFHLLGECVERFQSIHRLASRAESFCELPTPRSCCRRAPDRLPGGFVSLGSRVVRRARGGPAGSRPRAGRKECRELLGRRDQKTRFGAAQLYAECRHERGEHQCGEHRRTAPHRKRRFIADRSRRRCPGSRALRRPGAA